MEYKKERNFIVAYDDDGKVKGKFDILHGLFYGVKGTVIHNVSSLIWGTMHDYIRSDDVIKRFIYWFRSNYSYDGYETKYYTRFANIIECCLSVGLYIGEDNLRYFLGHPEEKPILNKNTIKYCQENLHFCYVHDEIKRYVALSPYKNKIKDWPKWAKDVFENLMTSSINYNFNYCYSLVSRYILEHCDCIGEIMTLRKDITLDRLLNMGIDYYNKCMAMYEKVEVPRNIINAMINTTVIYKAHEDEFYNKELCKNNDKDFLYYKNDVLEAKPILTKDGFHDEAEQQHNCVERLYMDMVKKGNTYIVQIRRIDSPNQAYITCEVTHDGQIEQYLGFGNSRNLDETAMNFRNEYQNHLTQALK